MHENKKNRQRINYWAIAALFILTKLCLHFFTNTNYELHRDEMLYFNMADHLSAGYVSVPPITSLLAFVSKTIFGYSVFGIRFFPALLGAGSLVIIAETVKDLGGGFFALSVASLSFIVSPGFLLFNSMLTPNVIEQFLWLMVTYLLSRLAKTNNKKIWIWIGILLAVSFLTKYSAAFYIASFFAAIIASPHRKTLNSGYFIFAVATGLIMILPNIFWQLHHGLPVVQHMGELNKTQLVHMNFWIFSADVFSFTSAATIVWIIGLFFLLINRQDKSYRHLGIGSLLVILMFILLNGKAYYILGVLPFLFAAGGYGLERILEDRLMYLKPVIALLLVGFTLPAIPFALPLLSMQALSIYANKLNQYVIYPFSRWEDGKVHLVSQVFADMTGWAELAQLVKNAYAGLTPEEQQHCTIYAERNYGYAGAIHFYGHPYGLPEPVTFLESYVLWAPDTIPQGPLILINYSPGDLPELFHEMKETGTINNPFFRENGLKVFLFRQPKATFTEVYKAKSKAEKMAYQ